MWKGKEYIMEFKAGDKVKILFDKVKKNELESLPHIHEEGLLSLKNKIEDFMDNLKEFFPDGIGTIKDIRSDKSMYVINTDANNHNYKILYKSEIERCEQEQLELFK